MAWELVKHERPAAGWFYVGQAEVATFDVTLPPEELPGVIWFADKITGALIEATGEEGVILDSKVYFDPSSWYECKYRVIVTAKPNSAPVSAISAIGWLTVIFTALIIVGIGIVAWILQDVQSTPWLGVGLVAIGVGAGAFGIGYLVKTAKQK